MKNGLKMKLKLISIIASIPLFSQVFAQDFCSQMGAKLSQSSTTNSIVQTIRYDYTVAGVSNYAQLVEYNYDTKIIYDDSSSLFEEQDEVVDIDDEQAFNNFKNRKKNNKNINTSPTVNIKLTHCSVSGNSANFTITRIVPALTLNYYNQQNLPQFNINFIKKGNAWSVSNVVSYNFTSLIHESLSNIFRNHYVKINRTTPETFYSVNLLDMTKNQIYPAHTRALTSHFNNLIQGIN